ncbi:MAG: tRNA pseudouridine(55) synthase TruB [Flavobacteriaceae bacterium]|nr:tRNA pseudouridine(55) synthase TruB [Flavobacteriaceae bacterium]
MVTAEDYQNGQVLLIDKPLNWTSFQVVNKLRFAIKKKFGFKKIKVGHAGTLDPLATGLLIICTGKFTKQINTYQAQEKTYTGTFTLGATTASCDLESEINQTFPTAHIDEGLLSNTLQNFIGIIDQKPPLFSAIQKDGKRLYTIAREGKTIEIASRKVEIKSFELTQINMPEIDFKVVCGKGTYIRSLAHDFGLALKSGAHLSALRRTRIGGFSVENAETIESFIEKLTTD